MRYLSLALMLLLISSCDHATSSSRSEPTPSATPQTETAQSESPDSASGGVSQFKVGGFYSIKTDPGRGLTKVLVADGDAVYIRIYANKRPDEWARLGADPAKLQVHIECIRLTHQNFKVWEPKILLVQPVTEEELQSYRDDRAEDGF